MGFAVDDPESLLNSKTKWAEEALRFCPDAPIILVGLKKDTRRIKGLPPDQLVSIDEAQQVARHIGAKKYMECSALTGEGVDDVFELATRTSLLVNKEPGQSCCSIS